MRLFNFQKPKKDKLSKAVREMIAPVFPKGEEDINAATDEVLHILNNSISREDAKHIALKSTFISRLAKPFDEERLREHLAGYCLSHFNDAQVRQLYGYVATLEIAMRVHGSSPAEIKRNGTTYSW